jgi:hypothetical protein
VERDGRATAADEVTVRDAGEGRAVGAIYGKTHVSTGVEYVVLKFELPRQGVSLLVLER